MVIAIQLVQECYYPKHFENEIIDDVMRIIMKIWQLSPQTKGCVYGACMISTQNTHKHTNSHYAAIKEL